jgi:uncharacterized paraquat-inducible protein A
MAGAALNLSRCPHCRTPLALAEGGFYRCPGCRRPFDYFPARIEAPPLSGPEAPAGSHCAEHEGNPAVVLCERCGDFLCALCATPIERRVYCPRCFDLLHERGAFRFSHTGFTAPRSALSLAWLSWIAVFVPGLNLVLAGLALVQALTALKRLREKPDLPGRGQAVGALVVIGLSVLFSLTLYGLIVWAIVTNT